VLGVGFLEQDGQPLGLGPLLRALEERPDEVGGGDVGEPAGRGEAHVAVAGGHVEHPLARAHIRGLAQALADDLQGGADHRVVARRPGGALARLDGGEIRQRRGDPGGDCVVGGAKKYHLSGGGGHGGPPGVWRSPH
jgi:hypothetical protein